jgi:2,3-bisphosphoglycerate-independent phosphoglycerate mutase
MRASFLRNALVPTPKPVLLLILDGWGHRVDTEWNAIAQANVPNWRRLLSECPNTLIDTHGLHVGLPDEQMGNSEVGHMNIGAGRIVYQDLTRVDQRRLRDGSFARNPALVRGSTPVRRQRAAPARVRPVVAGRRAFSHEDHVILALTPHGRCTARVPSPCMLSLDGRDTPPKSAGASLRTLAAVCASPPRRAHRQRDRSLLRDGPRQALGAGRAARIARWSTPKRDFDACRCRQRARCRLRPRRNDEFVQP